MKVKPNRMLASDELNMIWYVCIYFHSVHSNLVISVLSDVANPWQGLVSALFYDFKISHLYSTHCKVWNLELDLNGYFLIIFSCFVLNGWESETRSHQELFTSRELLYTPYHTTFVGHILDCTHVGFEYWRVYIDRYWDNDFHVISNRFLFKLCSCLDNKFNFRLSRIFDDGFHPNQRLDMSVDPVSH